MYSRLVASITALAAVTVLAACGSSDDSASTTQVITVTRTVAAPSTTVSAPAATETATEAPETDDDPTIADTQTVKRRTGASAYVGHYQRHESLMDLESNQTGTLLEGASAVDGENWAISWRPAAQGITITYEQLLEKSGKGLEAGLAPGRTFSARFTIGETGKQILSTSAIPPSIIAVGWCRSGTGGSPECGA